MSLISSEIKIELERRWIKHSVLSSTGDENDAVNSDKINFTIKDAKVNLPVFNLSAKGNRNISKHFSERT